MTEDFAVIATERRRYLFTLKVQDNETKLSSERVLQNFMSPDCKIKRPKCISTHRASLL